MSHVFMCLCVWACGLGKMGVVRMLRVSLWACAFVCVCMPCPDVRESSACPYNNCDTFTDIDGGVSCTCGPYTCHRHMHTHMHTHTHTHTHTHLHTLRQETCLERIHFRPIQVVGHHGGRRPWSARRAEGPLRGGPWDGRYLQTRIERRGGGWGEAMYVCNLMYKDSEGEDEECTVK